MIINHEGRAYRVISILEDERERSQVSVEAALNELCPECRTELYLCIRFLVWNLKGVKARTLRRKKSSNAQDLNSSTYGNYSCFAKMATRHLSAMQASEALVVCSMSNQKAFPP
jgi:hypothetical protein